jgi:CheY-like chemotaxis protein
MIAPTSDPPAGGGVSEKTRSPTRVLLVDASIVNRRLSAALLKQHGYRVDAAKNGVEALRMFDESDSSYDVVLMDCHMPEMDGFEAAEKIRNSPGEGQNIPIMALTGTLEAAQFNRCTSSGMDDCLTKPFRIAAFESALSRGRQKNPASGEVAEDPREPFWDEVQIGRLRATMAEEADEFIREMIDMYCEDLPEMNAALQQAVDTLDATAIRDSAHRFKGSAKNMGLARIAGVALKLEELGKSGNLEGAEDWFKRLKSLNNKIRDESKLIGV